MATYRFSTYASVRELDLPEICRRYGPKRLPKGAAPKLRLLQPESVALCSATDLADALAVALNDHMGGSFHAVVFPSEGRDMPVFFVNTRAARGTAWGQPQ